MTSRLLFVTILAASFITVFVLLAVVQSYYFLSDRALHELWDARADALVAALEAEPEKSSRIPEARLTALRDRYAVRAIEWRRSDGVRIVDGSPSRGMAKISRPTRDGEIDLYFDNSDWLRLGRRFRNAAILGVVSTLGGSFLMVFYLVAIARPISTLVGQARELSEPQAGMGEMGYLIETFRSSINTLKSQEQELKRLNIIEKARADDLDRVSATLTRSLSSGFIALDQSGNIVDLNASGRAILHMPLTEQVAGRTLEAALGDTPFMRVLQHSVNERLPLQRFEVTQSEPRASVIGLTTVPLIDESGRHLGLLAIFTDLTHIRQLESWVREKQALADLGEVSAGIAHEFRNSLATILGYLRLMRRAQDAEMLEKRLRLAEDEANQLSAAVERLLAFSRPLELERQRVQLTALIRDVAERLISERPEIEIRFAGPELEVDGDSALLSRAFENILRNAVESIEVKQVKGLIRVITPESQRSIVIEDNGIGLDPRDAEQLFLPFQSRKPNGFGLGLSLSKRILMLHGANIRLDGTPGAGARVTVEFLEDRPNPDQNQTI